MIKRTQKITFRLDESECAKLKREVKKSGLNQEAYLRHIINGLVPTNAPPPEYFAMMKQLHYIGNNMNQIAQKAHVLNVIDTRRFDDAYAEHKQAVITITEAVMLPRKIEIWRLPQSGQ